MNRKPNFANVLLSILIGMTLILSAAQPVNNVSASADELQGDEIRRGYHSQTGKLSFLGANPGNPIRVGKAMERGLSPEARGLANLAMYASEFGIQDVERELSVMKSSSGDGRQMVRYQQVFNGIPVMAGELNVNMLEDGSLVSINGEVSPELNLDMRAVVIAEVAKRAAIQAVAKAYNLGEGELAFSEPELWIFDERLLQENATQPIQLVWRMEVSSEKAPLRELVLVNAQTGKISLHFNQIDTAWKGAPAMKDDEPVPAPAAVRNSPASLPDLSLDRFVAPGGTDTGDCSEYSAPCATITYADSVAVDGDSIGVAEGIYTNGTGTVAAIHKSLNLSGGWNAGFDTQTGFSTIDGSNAQQGIYVQDFNNSVVKTVTMDHFIITGTSNSAISNYEDLTIRQSSLYDNHTYAMFNQGVLTVINTTITRNRYGVYTLMGTTHIKFSTITRNNAADGSGLLNNSAETYIDHTILDGNASTPEGGQCDVVGTGAIHSLGYNIVGTDCETAVHQATDHFGTDPLLTTFLPSEGYEPLMSDSPAIDAGNDAACETTDQRGLPRVDMGGDGTACDIGAYEYTPPGTASRIVSVSGTGQFAHPNTGFPLPLKAAVLDSQGSPVDAVNVTFSAPASGPSAIFTGSGSNIEAGVPTDSGGIATSSTLTANSQLGYFTVSADAALGTTVDFTLEIRSWYVSPSGNDANSCKAPAEPCATINAAINKASGGETINVAAGTYKGSGTSVVTLNKILTLSGGWDSSFTYQSGLSIVDGEHARNGFYVSHATGTASVIDHFGIINGSPYGYGIEKYMGNMTLTNSAIYNNDSTGVYNQNGGLEVENITVSNNLGSGVSNRGQISLTNVTISDNGKVGFSLSYGTATLTNTILFGNSWNNPSTYDCTAPSSGTLTSGGGNIIGDITGCTITPAANDQFDVDPGLGTFLPSHGVHPLLPTSIAINNGILAACPDMDQRGIGRGGDPSCDSGAYEYATPGTPIAIWIETGNLQRARIETSYPRGLTVSVLDGQGNPVSGVNVTFTAPLSGPSGTFAGSGTNVDGPIATDASGTVESSLFTANSEYGTFTVNVSAEPLTPIDFNLENLNWAWYVAPGGADTNTCKTPADPCATINAVINQASPTDTLFVAEGTYVAAAGDTHVVKATKSLTILGGWNPDFTAQTGYSTVDGEKKIGVVYVYGSQVQVSMDRFMVINGADGGVSLGTATLAITNSGIFNNVKSNLYGYEKGAGVYNNRGKLTLNYVTISNNSTGEDFGVEGGGLYSEGTATLNNVTITNNTAWRAGGVLMYTGSQPGATISIKNTIIYNNHASDANPDCSGQSNVNANNIVGDTSGCTMFSVGNNNQLNVNPLLGAFIEGAGYQPLLSGSPAINAGADCFGTADQRGYTRVDACDIGAYEYPASIGDPAKLVFVDGSGQRTPPLSAFPKPLAVAVLDAAGSPVDGEQIEFTAPSTGPSGTFPGGLTTTSISSGPGGIASVALTANAILGSYQISAELADFPGIPAIYFNMNNLAWYVRPAPDGNDANDCATPLTPCATINGALGKLEAGDTVNVAAGTYTYSGSDPNRNYVVIMDKPALLLGGWNAEFTTRDGYSIIDGQNGHQGVSASGVGGGMDRFIVENGYTDSGNAGMSNYGTFSISNSVFRNNRAESGTGGLSNSGTLTLDHVQIHHNSGTYTGGIANSGRFLTINYSAIHSNTAYDGGGIYSFGGIITINNSTISRNVAINNGGGIDNNGGSYVLNNVTISNNQADYGGGVYNSVTNLNSFLIRNTILAGNTAQITGKNCMGGAYSGSVKSQGNSLIASNTGCNYISGPGDKVNVNPLLGTFLPFRGYHPILTGSPAINAGAACFGTTDQRGVARVGACDMGAYEYVPIGAAVSMEIIDGDNQRMAPGFPFGTLLSVAVLDDNGSPVSGQSVTFSAPESGPSGTFADGTHVYGPILTDTGGVASSSQFTANAETGAYLVSAAPAAGSPFNAVDFHLANLAWFVRTDGSDANDCLGPATPCATIQAAIDKAENNDAILVAEGEYTSSASQVVLLTRSILLLGGWDSGFTSQSGFSMINANAVRWGVNVPPGVSGSMTHFMVTNNSWDGGIRNEGTLTLSQCDISDNNALAIINSGTLSLEECTVSRNYRNYWGGVIYNSGTLNIGRSIITGNGTSRLFIGVASSGIRNDGTAIISDTLITGNIGAQGGGINSTGTLVLNRSSVSNNISMNGGGLFLSGSASLLDSTIYGNSGSGPGGGIYSNGATLLLNNSTVSGNTGSSGGGIYKNGTGGKITIRNTILGLNKITSGTGRDCYGRVTSGGANIISNTAGCTVNTATGDKFNVNPMLGTYLPVQGYQPLLVTSPAINAGNSATCLTTDQRGQNRVGKCDIGAYEYITPGAPAGIYSPTWLNYHVTPNGQLMQPLQVAVVDAKGSPVGGVLVTFNAPTSGSGGVFLSTGNTSATVRTAPTGMATAPTYFANAELGDYDIGATISGFSTQFKIANLVWFVSTSGNNNNDCITPVTACSDITGVSKNPGFLSGDTIWVATGTYDVTGETLLGLDSSVSILGGWDESFTSMIGSSTFKDGLRADMIYQVLDVRLKNLIIEDTGTYAIINTENMVIENMTIRRNQTGIMTGGKMTVLNTTISDNTGGDGGIWSESSNNPNNTLTVINSTIARNDSQGIRVFEGTQPVTLINTIIIGNLNPMGAKTDCIGLFISGGHNIIGNTGDGLDSWSCLAKWQPTDQIGTKSRPIPMNKVLVSTLTQDVATGQWYYPLMFGSLAIDAGNTAPPGSGGKACPATDQLGIPRPMGVTCDSGAVEFQFNTNASSPLLVTYTAGHTTTLPGTQVCSSEDGTCSGGDGHATAAQLYAYSAYNKYLTWHNRDSIDGNGLQINSTVHYGSGYQNAFWNGYMLVYGDGYNFPLGDDIVAHEYTHGVTDYESGLFYWYQSGAINESFSDIWGEAVDQTNGLGNDTGSVLWLIGEDVGGVGIKRSMSNPPAYNQPDSIQSSHYCKTGPCLDDNGGVHTNSGVNNKAAYLMVRGGAFNGQTVASLGWTKTLAIYYEAQTNLLTRGSDYLDLYYALYQACMNKVGEDGIVPSDCGQVRKATLAVKMKEEPAISFNPNAPYCPSPTNRAIPDLFYEGFEFGTAGWTLGRLTGSVAWELSGDTARTGKASLWANDNHTASDSIATTRSISLTGGSEFYLHFSHTYSFETSGSSYYDGGVLEYSINNGKTWTDAKSLYSAGQNYSGTLLSGHGNPLQGRSAFVGDSHGFVDSSYKLSSLAGKLVRFRWRMGTDVDAGKLGWYVDDVRVYLCVGIPGVPTLLSPVNSNPVGNLTPTFEWSDSTGDLHHYQLQLATAPEFNESLVTINDILVSTYTLTSDLITNTTYYWRVRAFNAANKSSAWSAVWSFTTP